MLTPAVPTGVSVVGEAVKGIVNDIVAVSMPPNWVTTSGRVSTGVNGTA